MAKLLRKEVWMDMAYRAELRMVGSPLGNWTEAGTKVAEIVVRPRRGVGVWWDVVDALDEVER